MLNEIDNIGAVATEIADKNDFSRERLHQSVDAILGVKFKLPDAVMMLMIAGYDDDHRELYRHCVRVCQGSNRNLVHHHLEMARGSDD